MTASISTGSVRLATKSVLESVHLIEREFAGLIDGVELFFYNKIAFDSFELDNKAISFLNKLEFNTLHVPIKETEYGKNRETEKALEKIAKINKSVKLSYITFHPNHIKDFSALTESGFDICIENLPEGETRKGWQQPSEFQEFFKKWPQLGFCFDVNHAMANGIKPSEFVSLLGEKINYIHLNATAKTGNADHNLLVESKSETMQEIRPVFKLKKPMVIEVDIQKKKIPLIKKEIEFVKEFTRQ